MITVDVNERFRGAGQCPCMKSSLVWNHRAPRSAAADGAGHNLGPPGASQGAATQGSSPYPRGPSFSLAPIPSTDATGWLRLSPCRSVPFRPWL